MKKHSLLLRKNSKNQENVSKDKYRIRSQLCQIEFEPQKFHICAKNESI